MKMMKLLMAIFLINGLASSSLLAGEHPEEHPKSGKKSEHSKEEHPEGEKKVDVTKKMISKAIKEYVKRDSKLKGGYFLVYDKVDKKVLQLKLDRVHDDRLSKVSKGVYFACADFKNSDGVIYDLDVFMKGHKGGHHLKATEVSVHKKGGKARYGWVEKDGIWKKK